MKPIEQQLFEENGISAAAQSQSDLEKKRLACEKELMLDNIAKTWSKLNLVSVYKSGYF